MFAQYLVLLCVVGFSKSVTLTKEKTSDAIQLNLDFGCSESGTDQQVQYALKCFMESNKDYYNKTLDSIKAGGKCEKFTKSSYSPVYDLTPYCRTIVSVDDPNTRDFLNCVVENYGRYPSETAIPNTPACDTKM